MNDSDLGGAVAAQQSVLMALLRRVPADWQREIERIISAPRQSLAQRDVALGGESNIHWRGRQEALNHMLEQLAK